MPRRVRPIKSIKHLFYPLLARLLVRLMRGLTVESGLRIGGALGDLIWLLDLKGGRVALENLRSSFPDKPYGEIRRIARLCYRNIGMNIAEFGRFSSLTRSELMRMVRFEGMENLDRALSLGKGVLLLTAHFGNWELLGAALAAHGYEVNAIVRNLRVKSLDRIVNEIRSNAGFRPFYRERGLKSALLSLKRNQILALLADIDTRSEGVFVDFFGRPAYTPVGPVLISMKTGAPIVPAFIVREVKGHRVFIGEPIRPTGNVRSDVQRLTKMVEGFIRRYPHQWIWMHRRWRKR
ncbi:TPA: hypothetical protein EYP37_02215 [Candidatus Poribacteria bacterium]|nr:hypothetical protein [Candidatus Poribacteria bacterium]